MSIAADSGQSACDLEHADVPGAEADVQREVHALHLAHREPVVRNGGTNCGIDVVFDTKSV